MERAIIMICNMQYVMGHVNAICDTNAICEYAMGCANAICEYAMGRANVICDM